ELTASGPGPKDWDTDRYLTRAMGAELRPALAPSPDSGQRSLGDPPRIRSRDLDPLSTIRRWTTRKSNITMRAHPKWNFRGSLSVSRTTVVAPVRGYFFVALSEYSDLTGIYRDHARLVVFRQGEEDRAVRAPAEHRG